VRVGDAERGARAERTELVPAPDDTVRCHRFPPVEVAQRREVVVVDDELLRAVEHVVGDDRTDRHLVHEPSSRRAGYARP
jgi:hypothetical protein